MFAVLCTSRPLHERKDFTFCTMSAPRSRSVVIRAMRNGEKGNPHKISNRKNYFNLSIRISLLLCLLCCYCFVALSLIVVGVLLLPLLEAVVLKSRFGISIFCIHFLLLHGCCCNCYSPRKKIYFPNCKHTQNARIESKRKQRIAKRAWR